MRNETRSILDQLAALTWFQAVGQPVATDVAVLESWPEAIESCASQTWENVQNEMLNLVRDGPCQRDRARYNQWNNIVQEHKTHFRPVVAQKCAGVIRQYRLPKVFLDSVEWDIGGLLMESEYAELTESRHFHSLWEWYRRGHFPCGWEGSFPAGRLVIY